MTAIVEAVCYLGVPLDRIDILSIGTTEEPFTVKSMAQAGWARWGKTLIDLLMNAQVDSSVRHAQLLVGEPRFLRVNTVTAPGMYALDGSKEIEDLVTLGNRKGSDPEILNQVKSRFQNTSAPWTGSRTTNNFLLWLRARWLGKRSVEQVAAGGEGGGEVHRGKSSTRQSRKQITPATPPTPVVAH